MADQETTVDDLSSAEIFAEATRAAEPPPEAPAPEPPAPVAAEPPAPPPATPPEDPTVPSWRLREEAEARRVAEDRARAMETRLREIAEHLNQGKKPPSFYENPDEAANALVLRAMQPVVQEFQRRSAQQEQTLMLFAKGMATQVHGADVVNAAEKAFLDAREAETLDPADYERVVQSPNRYEACVQWHKRQQVHATVGNDPNAWFEAQLAAKMADPAFQAQLISKITGGQAKPPGTVVSLPPSLSKVTAASGNRDEPAGDLSNESLWAQSRTGR